MIQNNGYPGLYVMLDGIIGCGKSAQVELLEGFFDGDLVITHEPGGTPFAEAVRRIVKSRSMTSEKEMRYFARARRSTLDGVVRPVLERGALVISDRGFPANMAYQGKGRGLGLGHVWDLNERVVGTTIPDVFIFLDVGIEAATARSGRVDPDKFDREAHDFWVRVREGYREVCRWFGQNHPEVTVIRLEDEQGRYSIEEVNHWLLRQLEPVVQEWRQVPLRPPEGGLRWGRKEILR